MRSASRSRLENMLSMSTRVRRALPEDIDAVRYVGISTWPSTYGTIKGPRYVMEGLDTYWSVDMIRAAIEAGNIDVTVTSKGVVGMMEVGCLDEVLVMWKLYVLPSEQGSGLGHSLVDAAKDRARDRGCDLLTEYEPENSSAGEFYAREGFEPTDAPWPGTKAVWLRWPSDLE